MPPHFRQRLQQGDLLFGVGVTLSAPAVSELLAEAGFDWLFLDAEHAPLEPSALQVLLQAAGRQVAGIVRVPALTETDIKHVLDVGATGIVVPQVHSAELAAAAVRWARYYPEGTRGMGVYRANHYGFQVSEYLQQAAEQTVVVVQAESAEAVRNIDAHRPRPRRRRRAHRSLRPFRQPGAPRRPDAPRFSSPPSSASPLPARRPPCRWASSA